VRNEVSSKEKMGKEVSNREAMFMPAKAEHRTER